MVQWQATQYALPRADLDRAPGQSGPEEMEVKKICPRQDSSLRLHGIVSPQRDDLTTNRQGPKDEALEKTMTTSKANLGESRKKRSSYFVVGVSNRQHYIISCGKYDSILRDIRWCYQYIARMTILQEWVNEPWSVSVPDSQTNGQTIRDRVRACNAGVWMCLSFHGVCLQNYSAQSHRDCLY